MNKLDLIFNIHFYLFSRIRLLRIKLFLKDFLKIKFTTKLLRFFMS